MTRRPENDERTQHAGTDQENALTAALECDRELGFSTFMNDPQMSAVSMEDGRALFDDMLENQRRFLPAAWF